jgi:hypothetical protein
MTISDKSTSYITLKEATRFCDYSQEYLSLRARRGKLKAVKFGRNWMTKKEWLDEYLTGTENYYDFIEGNKKIKQAVKTSEPLPPSNLPVDSWIKMKISLTDIRPSLVTILVITLLGFSWLSAKETTLEAYNFLSPYVMAVGQAGDFLIQEGAGSLASVLKDIEDFSDSAYLAAINPDESLNFTSSVFHDYWRWLKSIVTK